MSDNRGYDLTCWYLNLRRIAELVGASALSTHRGTADASGKAEDVLARFALLAAGKDALVEWMYFVKPPTIGELILAGDATPGKVFTHYSNFYCKGLRQNRKNNKTPALAEIYSKLDDIASNIQLRIEYHTQYLTSESAWSTLSGQRRLFVLAFIDTVTQNSIMAKPYAISSIIHNERASIKGNYWNNRCEVFIDSIDSFSKVRNEPRPRENELNLLKNVPEKDIKRAIAEIISEPNVPKDWGGESSDLFSTNVLLDGKRVSTAFAFKGPAKFKRMTMADLGKNGDQIHRLFSEPADLLILQHCHVITPPVRGAMRAYATNISNPRMFTLVDGYDTIRVLRAYGKCQFTPTVPATTQS